MNKATYFPIILGLVLLISACNTSLVKDMAQFDKTFIPAQYFAYFEQEKALNEALITLEKEWRVMMVKYENFAKDEKWKHEMIRIDRLLKEAQNAIEENEIHLVRDKLQSVQYILADRRAKNGIKYIPDALYTYGEHIKWLHLITATKTTEDLNQTDWYEMRNAIGELSNDWNQVRAIPINTELFGWDEKTKKQYDTYSTLTTENMEALKWALKTGDKEVALASSKILMENYESILKLFGNFEQFNAFLASTHF